MKLFGVLSKDIDEKYGIKIKEVSELNRLDIGNQNQLLRLLTEDGQSLFAKEVPVHSLRDGLDQLYSELSRVHPVQFRMVLPISSNAR